MNPYREELRSMLAGVKTQRPAVLRRSRSEQWMYATDLPLIASEDMLESFARQAREAGWTTGSDGGWLQLDRPVREPLPGMIPREWKFCPAAACCRSLLERHRGHLTVSDGQAERMLVKAAEESPDAYEEACRKLHSRWAEALRTYHGIPAVHMSFFNGGDRDGYQADPSRRIPD